MGTGNPGKGTQVGWDWKGKSVWERYGEKEILVVLFGYIRLFFWGGNDLGVEILVTRYVMLFFVG